MEKFPKKPNGISAIHQELFNAEADLSNFTSDQRAEYFHFFGERIQEIEEPTEEEAIASLYDDVDNLKYIKNRTRKVMEVAVKLDGVRICQVENPDDEMDMLAVRSHPMAIMFIIRDGRDTKEKCLESVRNYPSSLTHIMNQTDDLIIEALSQDINAIKWVNVSFNYLVDLVEREKPSLFKNVDMDKLKETHEMHFDFNA